MFKYKLWYLTWSKQYVINVKIYIILTINMIFNLILILGYLKLYASYDKDIYLLFVYDQIMISLILVYTNVIY